MQKRVPQERISWAPKFEERTQDEPPETGAMRPQRRMGPRLLTRGKEAQDTFHFPAEAWVMPAPSSKKPEGRELVIVSRSVFAHAEQKGSKLR